jgi:hypothetical protein
MKNFLSDLWHDLREKRLWPVAVVLLAALVAVPVVLSKSAEEPPAPAPAAAEARSAPEPRELAGLKSVKLEDGAIGTGSSLDTFDPSNPFRPPSAVLNRSKRAESQSSQAGPGDSPTTDKGSTGSTGGTVTGGGTGDTDPVDTGGGDTGGGDTGGGDTGGGDTGGGDTGGGDTGGGTTTTQYAYVIDVTFEANGRSRRIKAMKRLDMLPNPDSPLLLFLGVASDGGNAVFLVDSTLDAAGEGSCKPSRDDCAFLHLGAGSEHQFTNEEGESYTLRVDEIRRVKVGSKASASKKDSKTAGAAVGRTAPARRFSLPLLADLVSVSSGGGDHSNRDKDSR